MRTRLRILNKEIIFPDICPNHPEKSGIAKIRVTTQLLKNPFEKDHRSKMPVTPFSYDEELYIPVCDKCVKKFNSYKIYSKRLMLLGVIGFIPFILLGNFASNQLEKLNNILPIVIISLICFIYIGWYFGYCANKIPRISPRYKGRKGIEIEMHCDKHYIEHFRNMNSFKEI